MPAWYQPTCLYNPLEFSIDLSEVASSPIDPALPYAFQSNSFLYYVITAGALVCAALVLILGHPVHSLLALICAFIQLTLLMITNKIEYLGFVFLIVYVGAVSILFLFILMLFDLSVAFQHRYSLSFKKKLFSVIFLLATIKVYLLFISKLSFFSEMYLLKLKPFLGQRILQSMLFDFNEIFPVSLELYKSYAFPFFFVVILLLSAMLGSIIIAMHASSGVFCRYNVYYRLQTVLFRTLTPVGFLIFSESRSQILKTLLRISDFSDPSYFTVHYSDRLD